MEFLALQPLPSVLTYKTDVDERVEFYKQYRAQPLVELGSEVTSLALHPTDPTLVAVTYSTCVAIVNVSKGTVVSSWKKNKDLTTACAWRSCGKLLAAADKSGAVNVYQVEGQRDMIKRVRSREEISALSFSPGRKSLFTGSTNSTVKEWDLATGECLRTMAHHTDVITALLFAGELCISASRDGLVCMWAPGAEAPAHVLSQGQAIEAAVLSSGGMLLHALCPSANVISTWDLVKKEKVDAVASTHSRAATGLCLIPSQGALLTCALDGRVMVMEEGSLTCRLRAKGKGLGFNRVEVTADERHIVTACVGGQVAVWKLDEDAPAPASTKLNLAQNHRYLIKSPPHLREGAVDHHPDATRVVVPFTGSKYYKQGKVDQLLRKFEFHKVLDLALNFSKSETSPDPFSSLPHETSAYQMAVLDELLQRGVLVPCLKTRAEADVTRLIEIVGHAVRNDVASFGDTAVDVVEALLRTPFPYKIRTSRAMHEAMWNLSVDLEQELKLQSEITPLVGMLDMVFGTSE